ncbi:hypothetical protein N0V90_013512, partial [Kalmusia sp. IMI 367209]
MLDYSGIAGLVAGGDFAGTIVALGQGAIATGNLQVGDRFAGMAFGLNKSKLDIGAFARYVGTVADLILNISDEMSFEEGATLEQLGQGRRGGSEETADIRAYTNNEIAYASDCFFLAETTQLQYTAIIGRAGGRYCSLEPF